MTGGLFALLTVIGLGMFVYFGIKRGWIK